MNSTVIIKIKQQNNKTNIKNNGSQFIFLYNMYCIVHCIHLEENKQIKLNLLAPLYVQSQAPLFHPSAASRL